MTNSQTISLTSRWPLLVLVLVASGSSNNGKANAFGIPKNNRRSATSSATWIVDPLLLSCRSSSSSSYCLTTAGTCAVPWRTGSVVLRSSQTETNNNSNNNNPSEGDKINGDSSDEKRRFDQRTPPPKNTRSYSTTNRVTPNGGQFRGNNNNNSNDPNRRPPPRRQFGGPGGATTFGGGAPRFNGAGGGGGGGPSLRLENPRKLSRVVDQQPGTNEEIYDAVAAPPRQAQGQRNDRQQQNRRPMASADGQQAGGVSKGRGSSSEFTRSNRNIKTTSNREDGDAPDPIKGDASRRRRVPGAVAVVPKRKANDDGENRPKRKTSLRVDSSGRSSRSVESIQRRGSLKRRDRSTVKAMKAEAALERKTVYIPEGRSLTVSELADIIDEKPVSVIKLLMTELGVMASMTQSLDPATCLSVARGFGKIVAGEDDMDEELLEWETSAISTGVVVDDDDDPADLVHRAPVVTIMGHVDHGKTSLLDTIRSTDVTATEAGGITQHIAAYQVQHKGQDITFIDTPGHSAFTDMRERGANITDIVILVVAADDGVKQQTVDSIMCARQAGVPIIVAINKIDKETADPGRVMTELTQYDILTEDLGGDVLVAQVSAKQKTNIDDLLDKIMLQAEIQDLKANPNRDAECIVIEAYVEKGLGTVATTLVKRGTLKIGDVFIAGETYGRVRALLTTTGNERLKQAGPGDPVRVVGFEGVPSAGDILVAAKDEQTARELVENRKRIARESSSSSYQAGLMSSMSNAFGAKKQHREMCVVVKADVQGSAEALTRALRELKLEDDEAIVTVKVLVSETGEISKSDIAIASVTPGTTVLAFNVAASMKAMDDARSTGVSIEYYNIIYDAIESVESRMQEVLSPTPDGEYVGSAVVQEVFNIGGTGNIAGSRCKDGLIKKGGTVRVMRGDKILIETRIKSLRNFKAETDTIEEGNECGIGLVDFEDFQKDDVIECYVE